MSNIIIPNVKIVKMDRIGIIGHICAVLTEKRTGIRHVMLSENIVTDEGDLYYAQFGLEQPKYDFPAGGLKLGTGVTPPTKSDTDVTTAVANSYKSVYPGYPKTNDDDANNTYNGNADYRTWKYYYDDTEVNVADIGEGAIVDAESPSDALCHFLFAAPFTKTSSYYLTVYVNHEFLGA